MPWWGVAVLVFGGNFTLWGTVGLFRLLDEFIRRLGHRSRRRHAAPAAGLTRDAGVALARAAGVAQDASAPGGAAAELSPPGKAVPAGELTRSLLGMPTARPSDELTLPLPAVQPAPLPSLTRDGVPGPDAAARASGGAG